MPASPRSTGAVLSQDLYDGLREIAAEEETSVAAIVRRAVKKELERCGVRAARRKSRGTSSDDTTAAG